MSMLWGLFETFLDFLSISVEPQHRDKIPQLGLITLYFTYLFTRSFKNGWERIQVDRLLSYDRQAPSAQRPEPPFAAKTLFPCTKRFSSENFEKKKAMHHRIGCSILPEVLHFVEYNFSYLKHPNAPLLETHFSASVPKSRTACFWGLFYHPECSKWLLWVLQIGKVVFSEM